MRQMSAEINSWLLRVSKCWHSFLVESSFFNQHNNSFLLLIFAGNLTFLEDELTDAFKHFRFYFPKRPLPKGVYTTMTGFNYGILHIDNYYGIGLEYFLGEKGSLYLF